MPLDKIRENVELEQDWCGDAPFYTLGSLTVATQIESVLADLPVAATKTGMLATADIIRVVGELAGAGRLPNLVVDLVMVASSGGRLLAPETEKAYLGDLFSFARVITPNTAEAEVLLGGELATLEDMIAAGWELRSLTGSVVVVKGGEGEDESRAVDVVVDGDDLRLLEAPRVETRNDHGTGCSFASAVAALLARGTDLHSALDEAKRYVHRGLTGAARWRLGAGHGPIDHFSGEGPD